MFIGSSFGAASGLCAWLVTSPAAGVISSTAQSIPWDRRDWSGGICGILHLLAWPWAAAIATPSSRTHRIACLATLLLINNLRWPWTILNSLLTYHTYFRYSFHRPTMLICCNRDPIFASSLTHHIACLSILLLHQSPATALDHPELIACLSYFHSIANELELLQPWTHLRI